MQVIQTEGAPVKMWVDGVQVEEEARNQLLNTAKMPFIYRWVAAMPDVHLGIGATVGSVVATDKAIIPAAVGVDIGCGMTAAKLGINASDLPDSLSEIRSAIEAAVPHGRTDNGGKNDRGAWGSETPGNLADYWYQTPGQSMPLVQKWDKIRAKHPKVDRGASWQHLGTLGSGNHFIELCLDESDDVWVMLHSGSRGIGNRIGSYFIDIAKQDMKRWFINLPDSNLAYFPEGTDHFNEYVEALAFAQDYAKNNRRVMLNSVLRALGDVLGHNFDVVDMVVSCHHNYAEKENHFGQNVWVTRKGAVRAREGDLGIIPGSMGTRSYIVRGLGNPNSFMSCSHGAGRRMSRNKAREVFTLEDHALATLGIECRKDDGVLDETPGAYKDIDAVMAAQRDLVEVVHTLRQVVCVKG